jgi:hypothetical protein
MLMIIIIKMGVESGVIIEVKRKDNIMSTWFIVMMVIWALTTALYYFDT